MAVLGIRPAHRRPARRLPDLRGHGRASRALGGANPIVARLAQDHGLVLLTLAKVSASCSWLRRSSSSADAPTRGRGGARGRHHLGGLGALLEPRHDPVSRPLWRRPARPSARGVSLPSRSTARPGRRRRTQSRTAQSVVSKAKPDQGMSSTAKGCTSSDSGVTAMRAADDDGLVGDDHDRGLRSRVDAHDGRRLDDQARLLARLPHGALDDRLVGLEEAARLGPVAETRVGWRAG